MNKIALIPGSFDPITKGHENVILRAAAIFDKIIIAIMINGAKKSIFSKEERIMFCNKTFKNYENIQVISYDGLLVDLYKECKATVMVKGIRNTSDYVYETDLSQINKSFGINTETIFIPSLSEYQHISSSMVREMLKYQIPLSSAVPDKCADVMLEQYNKKCDSF